MNTIQISSEDLYQYANQLQIMEQEVVQIFQQMKNKMNHVESIWSSPASKNMMAQFQQSIPMFDQYIQALGQYAIYLNQTASSYAENEQIMTTNFMSHG